MAKAIKSTAKIMVSLKTISSAPLLVLVFPAKSPPPNALPSDPSDCCSNINRPKKIPKNI